MSHQQVDATPGYVRPNLPPEGERNFLDDHPWDVKRSPLPDDVLLEEALIPMSDGVYLAATVFRPRSGAPVPVITTMTPYVKDRYDQWELFRDPPLGSVTGFYMGTVQISDHTPFEAPDPGYWVPNGYAVVLIDSPGRGQSGSNPDNPPAPEQRWADAMAWMAEQNWCTGNVGMSGVSALCMTQWIVAKNPPPQLKAIIPWEGFNKRGPGAGYGGIPEIGFGMWLVWQWLEPSLNPDAFGPEPEFFAWDYDLEAINVPSLVCGSFSDQELHSWDTLEAYLRMRSKDKWLFGHRRQKWGAYYGQDELALQKRFLDRFLKGDESAMDGVPPVRLEINESRDSYKVMHATTWPVEGTRDESLYLDAGNGTLTKEPVPGAESTTFAPEPIGDHTNRAVFDYRFEQDTDIVGYMALTLWIEAENADDVDLFVGIEKLDANGDEVYFYSSSGGNANGPVARGWLRASKRELDPELSTSSRPVLSMKNTQLLSPGEVVEVTVPIMPSGTTFRAGETLRLVIQSWSAAGQWDGAEAKEWQIRTDGRTRLHTGGRHASRLLTPVLTTGQSSQWSSIQMSASRVPADRGGPPLTRSVGARARLTQNDGSRRIDHKHERKGVAR
jgi:uncharacterized protein